MSVFGEERVQLDLDRESFDLLLFALGAATGAACKEGNHELVKSLFRLVNTINAGNPNFTPYDVETGERVEQGRVV